MKTFKLFEVDGNPVKLSKEHGSVDLTIYGAEGSVHIGWWGIGENAGRKKKLIKEINSLISVLHDLVDTIDDA